MIQNIPFHLEQIEFARSLALHRIEWLNSFFIFLNFFDTPYFFFLLIPIVWVGFSYRWGIHLFYYLTINSWINGMVKVAFGWPRPSTDLPEQALIHLHSYGFPSGAAQTSMLLGGLLIYYWRTKVAWMIGVSYILLISFSRMYLGVHYPLDILGGWILGLAVLTLLIQTKPLGERLIKQKGLFFSCLLGLLLPLLVMAMAQNSEVTYFMSAVIGISTGVFFSLTYKLFLPRPKRIREAVFRASFAVALTCFFVYFWPSMWPRYTQAFGCSLIMSLLASPLCRWALNSRK